MNAIPSAQYAGLLDIFDRIAGALSENERKCLLENPVVGATVLAFIRMVSRAGKPSVGVLLRAANRAVREVILKGKGDELIKLEPYVHPGGRPSVPNASDWRRYREVARDQTA